MSSSETPLASVAPAVAERLKAMYEAFNARHADRVLQEMTADVDWPNGWEGGRVTGQHAVRDYWTRQWQAIDPVVTPVRFTALPDGRVQVHVHQVVHDRAGALLADTYTHHVYAFRDGLIQSMEIVEA